ncbi:MAG TPA: SIR2 family protein [Candidatus Angelobacter sp.]
MQLPDILVNQVREGKTVIFLGAGASKESKDRNGKRPPDGRQLAKMISDKFFGDQYSDSPLTMVADYAISESDLGKVQSFLKDVFEHFEPSEAHNGLAGFRWHGIATTNYERLIEKAYTGHEDALQSPQPLIEDTDRVEENQRDPRHVLLLKLHGCVSRIASEKCPLILTPDQYITHKQTRARLFGVFSTWAYEHPIIFIGSSLQDPDIRAVLNELLSKGDFSPRNYIVAPDVDEISSRFWTNRRVTVLKGTFSEFMRSLDAAIPNAFRGLASIARTECHPIESLFKAPQAVLSRACAQFLDVDASYVAAIKAPKRVTAKDFYMGVSDGFGPIEDDLDVRRELADTVVMDHVIRDQQEPSDAPEVVMVKAHAGAGKSIFLHRIAWDATRDFGAICLFMRSSGMIHCGAIQEIIQNCRQRVYLFVDDAADREKELLYLMKHIGPEGRFLTIFLAERINEWNMVSESVGALVTEEHELPYLTSREIDGLLSLLRKHKALGTLQGLSEKEQRSAFAERAGRQLLVALHEATFGYSFEQILLDEYNHILPFEAQRIYLTVSILNRLNIPVRAGIISRIHGIAFPEFHERFFAPLEHVVFADYDPLIRDYTYRTRHPHIADILFIRILANPDERYDLYLKVLQALNLSFSVDKRAFWLMMKGRSILNLFPSHERANALYTAAESMLGADPHLLHQKAIYEMNRPKGDLRESLRLLNIAKSLAPDDTAIQHTVAELKLRAVDESESILEKEKLVREATDISLRLISAEPVNSYAHHTLIKAGLKKLGILMEQGENAQLQECIRDIELNLYDGLQRFPGDPFLLESESELASILADKDRVYLCLKSAFDANPRSAFVALRLSSLYRKKQDYAEARKVLEKAIDANMNDRRLHFAFATLLMEAQEPNGALFEYHLRRSFTQGDSNFDAQLLYARQLFINGKPAECRKIFEQLRLVRVPPSVKTRLVHPLSEVFEGRIKTRESSYCFITRDGFGDCIYAHSSAMSGSMWSLVTVGTRVSFKLAFNFKGPSAFEVIPLDQPLSRKAQLKANQVGSSVRVHPQAIQGRLSPFKVN